MKITFCQKKIGIGLNPAEKTKLFKERSDFLLLPYRFFIGQSHPEKTLASYQPYLDQLVDISEKYKGVVLGGSLCREESGKKWESVPLVYDMNLVDHYDLRNTDLEGFTSGDSEISFIMAGVRFSILAGGDIYDAKLLDEISEKEINTIFFLDGGKSDRTYEEDLEFFIQLSKERNWNIFRICGHDLENGIEGRSLVSTPTGIQWKVGKMEVDKDIIKTIHFAQANPFL